MISCFVSEGKKGKTTLSRPERPKGTKDDVKRIEGTSAGSSGRRPCRLLVCQNQKEETVEGSNDTDIGIDID